MLGTLDHGVAEIVESLRGNFARHWSPGILEDGRSRGDENRSIDRGNTEGDCDDLRGGRRVLEDLRGPRALEGRGRGAFRALRVILEVYVMVRMLWLCRLAFAGRFEGNVALWRKK